HPNDHGERTRPMVSTTITKIGITKTHEAIGPQTKREDLDVTRAMSRRTLSPNQSTVATNGHRTLALNIRTTLSKMTHLPRGAITIQGRLDTHHRRGRKGTTTTVQQGTNGPPQ
ncbi:MAG: hypothetical protein J0651_02415, partial [Actinobacteria bacterium]|nr:hypothetical protein [Actinomycetota bacterium]